LFSGDSCRLLAPNASFAKRIVGPMKPVQRIDGIEELRPAEVAV
jgi:hypothetical protein